MDDADGLATQVWRCFGRTVGLRAPEDILLHFHELIPPSVWRPSSLPPERLWTVSAGRTLIEGLADGVPIGAWEGSEETARAVRGDMEIWLGSYARELVLVHASVVAVDGGALVAPGPSMAGKSTLAAALVKAGAAYLSDEFAVLDRSGFVHPYPRPLCVRDEEGGRRHVTAAEVGHCIDPSDQGLPVRLLAEVAFDEASAGLCIREISRAQAVLTVLANSVAARTQTAAVLETAVASVGRARCFSGTRGEAEGAATELLELMRTDSRDLPVSLG